MLLLRPAANTFAFQVFSSIFRFFFCYPFSALFPFLLLFFSFPFFPSQGSVIWAPTLTKRIEALGTRTNVGSRTARKCHALWNNECQEVPRRRKSYVGLRGRISYRYFRLSPAYCLSWKSWADHIFLFTVSLCCLYVKQGRFSLLSGISALLLIFCMHSILQIPQGRLWTTIINLFTFLRIRASISILCV